QRILRARVGQVCKALAKSSHRRLPPNQKPPSESTFPSLAMTYKSPHAIPLVSTGLSTRLIDGAENNWPSYVTTNHYKLAPYYTLTEHTMGPELLVVSPRAWESLSAEDQDIFRDAARKSSAHMRELWHGFEERSR